MSLPTVPKALKPNQFKRKPITKVIIDNAASPNPLSPTDLAYLHKLDLKNVYRVMSRLRRDGRISGGHGPNTHHKGGQPIDYTALEAVPIAEVVVSQLLNDPTLAEIDAILTDPVMQRPEHLRRLSEFGRSASPTIAMKAMEGLAALQRGTGTHIGPPVPLTEPERVSRLAQLMQGCGKATVDAAILVAFPSEAPIESQTTQDSAPRQESTDSGSTLG